MTRISSPWIVLKFGGTSVATLANWTNIAGVAAERCAGGARVLIVHSAVSGITDRLERLLSAAVGEAYQEELAAIEERHRRLAADLGVTLGEEAGRHLAELREIARAEHNASEGLGLSRGAPVVVRDGTDHA